MDNIFDEIDGLCELACILLAGINVEQIVEEKK
jgi:hypothetical protein